MPYDTTEAKELLAKAVANDESYDNVRADAAQRLLDELVQLSGAVHDLTIARPPPGNIVEFQLRHRIVRLGRTSNGTLRIQGYRAEGYGEVTGLTLTVLANPPELYGEEPAQPGQPPRRRSGLAVVVEAALRAMGN